MISKSDMEKRIIKSKCFFILSQQSTTLHFETMKIKATRKLADRIAINNHFKIVNSTPELTFTVAPVLSFNERTVVFEFTEG